MARVHLIYTRTENADRAERTLVSAVSGNTYGPHYLGMNQTRVIGQLARRIASLSTPIKC